MGKLSAVTNALGVLFHRTSPATQAQPPPPEDLAGHFAGSLSAPATPTSAVT
jgi:hypothetical protein